MVKKIRRMRTFARTASKSMEKHLVENTKKLKKDPYLILPDYDDDFSNISFRKTKKRIEKISKYKDDTKKLEKLANKRNIGGALAGTLLIAHSEKAPYLAVAKFPTGDITYAQRGRADKEQLIGVQHFDDPVLRLLSIKNIALKTKIYIYSWDEGFLSTGRKAKPPKEFVDFIIKKIGLNYKDNVAVCKHLKPDIVKKKKFYDEHYLRLLWNSADVTIGICEDCSKSKKNTLFSMTKYMINPEISKDFDIEVIGQIVKGKKPKIEQETQFIDEYVSGKITDNELIKKNIKQKEQSINESGEKIFILDGTSYGANVDDFIKALDPNKFEKEGLEIILDQVNEPVNINNGTPNKVLEKFWKDYGLKTINKILNDSDMSKEFFALDDQPSDILELVSKYKERQKILSKLPNYKSLPPLARFVDNIARTFKTFGEKQALLELKKVPDTPKAKSVAYAFLLVFGKGKDKKWKYSQVEIEYGEFLKEYAKKLLDSSPEGYNKILQEFLTASGSSEKINNNLL